MSPIAKLFTVVNVVLAGVFLGWVASALSTTANFKVSYDKEVAAHKGTRETLSTEKSQLAANKQQAEQSRDQMRTERDEAKAEIDRLKGQLTSEEEKNRELRGSVDKIAASIDGLTAQNKQLQDSKDKAQQSQRDAEKAADAAKAAQSQAEQKAGDLDTKLHSAENQIADLEKGLTSSKKEAEGLGTQLASLADATGAKLSDFTPMPLIEGKVLDVVTSIEPGLVALNVGSDNKVKRGYTFEIYDGKTYKGQVRVEYVHPNMCSALIVRSVPGQKIKQGDGAATRL